jgi:vacuolar-type H+-ATPase subunit F/Vma7
MGRIAVVGERTRVAGFALAGVSVFPAEDAAAVRAAWQDLPSGLDLVILTPAAAQALDPVELDTPRPLVAVMPR